MGNAQEKANDMAYSAVALLAFFAAFHNADGVLGGDSMATAEQNLGATLVDEPMMMAPEPEFDLATSRSRVNQDPATLTRPELRYGNYLPLLGRGRRLLDSEEANGGNTLLAPAPAEDEEGTLELASERGRLGGRTGMNFGTGTLYTQNRFDNRRHLLEAHDDHDDHDDHDHDHDHEAEAEPAAAVVDDDDDGARARIRSCDFALACQPRSGDALAPGAAIRKLPAAARSKWTQATRGGSRPRARGWWAGSCDGAWSFGGPNRLQFRIGNALHAEPLRQLRIWGEREQQLNVLLRVYTSCTKNLGRNRTTSECTVARVHELRSQYVYGNNF